MNEETRKKYLRALLVMSSPPPNINDFIQRLTAVLSTIARPPPEISLDIRHGFVNISPFLGRDVFNILKDHEYGFFEITSETPESLQDILSNIQTSIVESKCTHKLTKLDRVLMFTLWLRGYYTYHMLSMLFDVSVSSIYKEISYMIPIFKEYTSKFLKWPSMSDWISMRRLWADLPCVVGAIDGTSTKIYRPQTELQRLYYSGQRKYQAIHTKIIIDSFGMIRHVECGFLGHLNDAQQYRLMASIGPRKELKFPGDCLLLADKIYPNGYPLMTPYTRQQISRRPIHVQRKCKKLNKKIQAHRVAVEHSIGQLKQYKILNTVC